VSMAFWTVLTETPRCRACARWLMVAIRLFAKNCLAFAGAKKATKQAKAAPKKQAKEKATSKKAPKSEGGRGAARVLEKEHRPGPAAPPQGRGHGRDRQGHDWQNHSIRGFISGNLTKKMGLTVESGKNELGERTYRIKQGGIMVEPSALLLAARRILARCPCPGTRRPPIPHPPLRRERACGSLHL